jgi:MoxR-like ATPase
MTATQQLERQLQEIAGGIIFGAEGIVRAITIALVMRGHVLVQGVPGIGKTKLSRIIAGALGGRFQRIQGTADLMPSDMTGVHVFERESGQFTFRPGPLFADVVLVDEINRAGPKTQSALLEAMEERQVTVDRDTLPLPADFLVIATQNPRELEGTYPLPESQLDRFLIRVMMGYPDRASELRVLAAYGDGSGAGYDAGPAVPASLLEAARREAGQIEVSDALHEYVLAIAEVTRRSDRLALGLSTRGVLALVRCARVAAAIAGDGYVTADHVREMVPLVINHRVQLTPEAMLASADPAGHMDEILADVPVPR